MSQLSAVQQAVCVRMPPLDARNLIFAQSRAESEQGNLVVKRDKSPIVSTLTSQCMRWACAITVTTSLGVAGLPQTALTQDRD